MIPTQGKFDVSLRVRPAVSVLLHRASRGHDGAEINTPRPRPKPEKGILGVSDEPLVSSDFRGDSRSSIIDSMSTMVLGGTMVKVIAWYDNEWGYSSRCADLVSLVASKLPSHAGSAA